MPAAELPVSVQESRATFTSNGKPIHVECFEPAGVRGLPAVLLLHGADGLRSRHLHYPEMARKLAGHGYRVLLIHYFDATGGVAPVLGPAAAVHFLTWMQVVRDALTYAGQAPGALPDRTGLLGVSLGAYLALAVAAQDARVAAVVECFGGLPALLSALVQRMPPVLILHGEADPLVPVAEAHRLEQLLRDKGQPYEIRIYPGIGHGFHGPILQEAVETALAFLDKYLRAH